MNTVLYISLHREKNDERRAELEEVLRNNLAAGFTGINILYEPQDREYIQELAMGHIRETGAMIKTTPVIHRPAFQEYINIHNDLISEYGEDVLAVVANSDIYFDKVNLEKLIGLPWGIGGGEQPLFVALSRWDETASGNVVHLNRADSQDSFIFCGHSDVTGLDCPLGTPGVDHRISHGFKTAGYIVVNPSLDIQSRHLHLVKVFNYRQNSKSDGPVIADMICPEPYHFVQPIRSSEIE